MTRTSQNNYTRNERASLEPKPKEDMQYVIQAQSAQSSLINRSRAPSTSNLIETTQ